MRNRSADFIVLFAATLSLPCCRRNHYAYEIINDSPDSLTAVRVADPNFSFPERNLDPYQGGVNVLVDGRIPASVQVRWQRQGRPSKNVRVNTGLSCPGRPAGELLTLQYWIRPDDSVRTRYHMEDGPSSYVDFVPCESNTERARRIANDELERAANAGDVNSIEAALKHAYVNPVSYFDPAPLHIAAAAGHLAAVKHLVERGARTEVPQRVYSQSALVVAIENGQLQIAEFLIGSGADLNGGALLAASDKGYASLVEVMLDRGANINHQVFGQSALIDAARAGHVQVVALLLNRGADPNTIIGGTSSTALDIAEQYRHSDVAALLIQHGARRGPHVH